MRERSRDFPAMVVSLCVLNMPVLSGTEEEGVLRKG
jgi:hypothetical protein